MLQNILCQVHKTSYLTSPFLWNIVYCVQWQIICKYKIVGTYWVLKLKCKGLFPFDFSRFRMGKYMNSILTPLWITVCACVQVSSEIGSLDFDEAALLSGVYWNDIKFEGHWRGPVKLVALRWTGSNSSRQSRYSLSSSPHSGPAHANWNWFTALLTVYSTTVDIVY